MVHWNRRLRLLCTLYTGVSRKFHLHFTLVFQLRNYKMVQSLYKNWSLVSKIIRQIWTTSDKQWEVQQVEICCNAFVQKIHFSKKYIPSAKIWYAENLSNINFNYLSENFVCHFWNHKLFFLTQLYCIFLAQIFHFFQKHSRSKCIFFRLSTNQVKVYQIFHIIFQTKSQFF